MHNLALSKGSQACWNLGVIGTIPVAFPHLRSVTKVYFRRIYKLAFLIPGLCFRKIEECMNFVLRSPLDRCHDAALSYGPSPRKLNLPTTSEKQKLCCIQGLQNSSGPGSQTSSGMMQLSLGLCLLATCIALGVSLECEECIGIGRNCHGNTIICSPGKDTCAIISTETMGQSGVLKTCMSSKNCGHGPTSLNMGKAGVTRTSLFCCNGNECRRDPPPLPRRNTTLNGYRCPACYALGSECKDEITQCAGDENFCFSMSGTTSMGSTFNTKINVKGCANEASCAELEDRDASIAGISVISDAKCTSGAAASASEIFGLLASLLIGVLFMKFFV